MPDPTTFPSLPNPLADDETAVIQRYVQTARDLAASAVVNATNEGVFVDIEDRTDIEHVVARLGQRDRQTGFAVLLRHCDSQQEKASFPRVANILWLASQGAEDDARDERLRVLAAWRKAVGRLHGKSLNQLLRDKLVADEGMRILDFQEPDAPQFLLSAFDYGDLLHWDRQRSVVAEWEQDDFTGADRRRAFLDVAVALAHVYIGFAELARSAADVRSSPPP